MSIFKSKWIIIKTKKIGDKKLLYTILSSDYWKILCNKKFSTKEKKLDLGYVINFEIEVKKWVNIHNIKNIKILSEFNSLWKKYSIIKNFLDLLNIVNKKLPEKLVNLEIFNTLEKIIKYDQPQSLLIQEGRLTVLKLILSQLKIINLLWLLNIENKDPIIKKILNFINKNKIENILKLAWINDDLERKLENILGKYRN